MSPRTRGQARPVSSDAATKTRPRKAAPAKAASASKAQASKEASPKVRATVGSNPRVGGVGTPDKPSKLAEQLRVALNKQRKSLKWTFAPSVQGEMLLKVNGMTMAHLVQRAGSESLTARYRGSGLKVQDIGGGVTVAQAVKAILASYDARLKGGSVRGLEAEPVKANGPKAANGAKKAPRARKAPKAPAAPAGPADGDGDSTDLQQALQASVAAAKEGEPEPDNGDGPSDEQSQ